MFSLRPYMRQLSHLAPLAYVGRVAPARSRLIASRATKKKKDRSAHMFELLTAAFLRRLYGRHWLLGSWVPVGFWGRSAVIMRRMHGVTLRVYRGYRWRRLRISRWHIGLRYGELARTRKVAKYRAKVRQKKRKKRERGMRKINFNDERWIENMRLVKTGKRRRFLEMSAPQEAQIRQSSWTDVGGSGEGLG